MIDGLVLRLSGRRRTRFELEVWAERCDVKIVAVKRVRWPSAALKRQFDGGLGERLLAEHLYYSLTVVDQDHRRLSGFARVRNVVRGYSYVDPQVDVVWNGAEQLNWLDRPPRASLTAPTQKSEGWYGDHTGRHEQRWYSAGAPTDLVKDGASESRDPVIAPPEQR